MPAAGLFGNVGLDFAKASFIVSKCSSPVQTDRRSSSRRTGNTAASQPSGFDTLVA